MLVERPAKRNPLQLAGRTDNNRWVNFAGPQHLINRFVDVEVTAALAHSLRGRLRPEHADSGAAARAAAGG